MRTWERFKKSYLLHSFKRDPVAILSFSVLAVLVIISILAPVVAPYNTYDTATIDIMDAEIPPAWMEGGDERFILGTDIQGRDLLSTMIFGLRVSLLIGVGAVLFQAFLGILVGLLSGYLGGKLDAFLMRIADIQFSIPYLIVAIFTSAIFKLAFGVGRYAELAVPLLIIIIGNMPEPCGRRCWAKKIKNMWKRPG
jgi:peptide/nickel transport system permease protein